MKPPIESAVPGWLFHALQNDPAYRVLTMDGLSWIDPYTGSVLEAPFGYQEVAKKHLVKTKPWARQKAKTLQELLILRWFYYLREHLEYVPTLRIFSAGHWLNPYRGEWISTIRLERDKVTLKTIEDMATNLAQCAEAQTGKMIESWRIDRLVADGPPQSLNTSRIQAATAAAGHAGAVAEVTPAVARPVAPPKPPASASSSSNRQSVGHKSSLKLSRQTDFLQIKQMLIKMLARPPRVEGFQTIVHYEPHSAISRDFYDIIQPDQDHLLLVVGDIEGQGPGSALMVASTLKALRQIAKDTGPDLIGTVCALSDKVRPDLLTDCRITLFAAMLDIKSRTLSYLSAGHHGAILLNKTRETPMQQLGGQGEALGRSNHDNFRRSLRPVQMRLEIGDILLLYSDGLFKVTNAKREEFGRFRLLASCVGNLGKTCSELVQQVLEESKAFANGKLSEDMTVVALRVKEPSRDGQDPTSFNESWLGRTQLS